MKLQSLIVLLFVNANIVFSQAVVGKEELKKKQEEKVVSKPPSFDSTKTFEEQYKSENQYQFIGLQLFLPPVINPDAEPILFSKQGNGVVKGNRYYTIVDILQGDIIGQLKQKDVTNQCGYRFKDINFLQRKDMVIYVVYVLKDNNKKDSLNNTPLYWIVCRSKQPPYICSDLSPFIAVPYFEKQKQVYKNQHVINLYDKSKWLCKEVSILKNKNKNCQDSAYDVFGLLVNEKGNQILLTTHSDSLGRSFITEKEYIWLDNADRNEREQLYKTLNEKQEKRKSECVKKFGQHFGELVAQDKIEIGMTTEMCKTAWGAPWNISKIKTSAEKKEIWFYNWKYSLHFENGKLIKIEH